MGETILVAWVAAALGLNGKLVTGGMAGVGYASFAAIRWETDCARLPVRHERVCSRSRP